MEFYANVTVITWVKTNLEKLDNELHVKVKKCVKQKHVFSIFPTDYRVHAIKR